MATMEITRREKVEAKTLKVQADVRYWDDAEINGEPDEGGKRTPCRVGDNWSPVIDVDKGVIADWPLGTTAKLHFKVCDAGAYALFDANGSEIVRREGYVPAIMCPGGNGYGDYIIMEIDGDGTIADWDADLSDFVEDDK